MACPLGTLSWMSSTFRVILDHVIEILSSIVTIRWHNDLTKFAKLVCDCSIWKEEAPEFFILLFC